MLANKQIPCARAIHSFESQSEHELSFAAGVSIMLLRRIDENWLEGKLDGKVGIFPTNYVKIEIGSPSGICMFTLSYSSMYCVVDSKHSVCVNSYCRLALLVQCN